jgi:hypothetical protein
MESGEHAGFVSMESSGRGFGVLAKL